jgi:hypothetical protein
MKMTIKKISVALEIGEKRTFASALEWPGWARSGLGEAEAINTLLAYGTRYQRAIAASAIKFDVPKSAAPFEVAERLKGNATTDFGAPNMIPATDTTPLDTDTLKHLQAILEACWKYFKDVVVATEGKSLRKGPRGGGRSLEKIVDHVLEAHHYYLRKIYWREPYKRDSDISAMVKTMIQADAKALEFATSGEMPETGPHGGKLWPPRYFIRRAAWHIFDHTWEIEDKVEG